MTDQAPGRSGRPTLSRVPPHDTATEQHLLGAALLTADAAAIVAAVGPDVFYTPRHQTIAQAVAHLNTAGHPTDPGTVAAHLRQTGQLDAAGGPVALIDIMSACPATRSAPHWAELIAELAGKRRILHMAQEVVEAVYSNLPVTGLVADMHTAAADTEHAGHTTWDAVNLAAVLAGEGDPVTPTAGYRTDGEALLYAGKTHALNAEPEAGKSMTALHFAAQEIRSGHHSLYVDFEADAPDVTERLLAMGLTVTQILEQFHYVRPDDPIDTGARARIAALCEAFHPTLAVIDGVTEAMAGSGWSINDNDDIAAFFAALPRPLSRAGPAVLIIDHVVKDKDTRGRWGIGGQHKSAGVDGVVYTLEQVRPFDRKTEGMSQLIVTKDRHGHIRPHAVGPPMRRVIADIRFTPGQDGAMTVTVDPSNGGSTDLFRPTAIMERISKALDHGPALTTNQVTAAAGAKAVTVSLALRLLVHEGYVQAVKQGQATYHSNLKPFRSDGDPGPTEPEQEDF